MPDTTNAFPDADETIIRAALNREAVRRAEAQRLGELIEETRKAAAKGDHLAIIKLKGEARDIDPQFNLESALYRAENLTVAKAGKLDPGKIRGRLAECEKRRKKIVADKANAIAEYDRQLAGVAGEVESIQVELIEADTNAARLTAAGGEDIPGYIDYGNPALRAWAKLAGVV